MEHSNDLAKVWIGEAAPQHRRPESMAGLRRERRLPLAKSLDVQSSYQKEGIHPFSLIGSYKTDKMLKSMRKARDIGSNTAHRNYLATAANPFHVLLDSRPPST